MRYRFVDFRIHNTKLRSHFGIWKCRNFRLQIILRESFGLLSTFSLSLALQNGDLFCLSSQPFSKILLTFVEHLWMNEKIQKFGNLQGFIRFLPLLCCQITVKLVLEESFTNSGSHIQWISGEVSRPFSPRNAWKCSRRNNCSIFFSS